MSPAPFPPAPSRRCPRRGRGRPLRAGGMGALLATLLLACGTPAFEVAPEPTAEPLARDEVRVVELRALRFDVRDYEERLTLDDLRRLPDDVRERLWLLDLELAGGPGSEGLLDNALTAFREEPPDRLTPAAAAMQTLLAMTPDTANLEGTLFEELVSLSALVGIAPEQVLADMLELRLEEPFLSPDLVADMLLENVVGTHPAATTRLGPRTAENPEGRYPVTPGAIPVFLDDLTSDFATLTERFGPVNEGGWFHPGFLVPPLAAEVLTENFEIRVRANANALPWQGVELGSARVASVGSIPSQVDRLFDFSDPDWLRIEGLVEGEPKVRELTLRIAQHDRFVAGGRDVDPRPFGGSVGWTLPAWTLERIVLDAALRRWGGLARDLRWGERPGASPLLALRVEEGWAELRTSGGLGSPPPPAYVWDLLVEIAQVRLRDGDPEALREPLELRLRDIPIGLTREALEIAVRENLEADPASLVDVAAVVFDATRGDADFYYVRTEASAEGGARDVLVFVDERDFRREEGGALAAPRVYANPGFFADEGLRRRVSEAGLLPGHPGREAVYVEAGDRLWVEDAVGQRYGLRVLESDRSGQLRVEVRRVR